MQWCSGAVVQWRSGAVVQRCSVLVQRTSAAIHRCRCRAEAPVGGISRRKIVDLILCFNEDKSLNIKNVSNQDELKLKLYEPTPHNCNRVVIPDFLVDEHLVHLRCM